jgi:methanol--5-hydroxybenzimidazolylcobamide Co-methyltransferase
MRTYQALAIDNADDFLFGHSPHPLTLKNGLVIGGGTVYPELNFTLPVMTIEKSTMPEVCQQYTQMIQGVSTRAVELGAEGFVVEFELLPELTRYPEWGTEITKILRETLSETEERHGVKTALRVTPNDLREFERPPRMRSGPFFDRMVESFEACAKAGADMLAIESTGGKEIHDEAIVNGDLAQSVFSLAILGARDMGFLWDQIVSVASQCGVVPSGDSACGFGNTAMVLAEQRSIPRVWSALIRVMTVPRSLVAFERGAVGPSKDCAYEGVYLKAITGFPISLEGAEAACAHLSPIGNIPKAVTDLWSNESVQNVKLLGAMAPTVSMEQLLYSTRLMNVAAGHGTDAARTLRDWFIESDAHTDPQAYVLKPDIVIGLARDIIAETSPYSRTRRAALGTLECLRSAHNNGILTLNAGEVRWLENLSRQADALPEDEAEFIAATQPLLNAERIHFDQYDL